MNGENDLRVGENVRISGLVRFQCGGPDRYGVLRTTTGVAKHVQVHELSRENKSARHYGTWEFMRLVVLSQGLRRAI